MQNNTPPKLAFHAGKGQFGAITGFKTLDEIAAKQQHPTLISLTNAARESKALGDMDAFNSVKSNSPWFMPNGFGNLPPIPAISKTGRAADIDQNDMTGVTGCAGFDWDSQPDPEDEERDNPFPPSECDNLLSQLREHPSVLWASRSISGEGVKAVLRVHANELPPDFADVDALKAWHARIWQAGVDILPCKQWQDGSVKSVNRLFYLSGDMDVYINPDAIPLELDISIPEPVDEAPDDTDFVDEMDSPDALPEYSDDGRLRVYTEHPELKPLVEFDRLANEIVDMNRSDTPYPFPYLNASVPAKLVEVHDGRIGEPLKIPGARRHLARIADFKGKGGKASVMPPGEYIAELMDNPPMAMPIVHHIQRAPMLVKDEHGIYSLHTQNGYVEYIDAMGEPRGAVMHGLPPDYPTLQVHGEHGALWHIHELLWDFAIDKHGAPFANALGRALIPIIRAMCSRTPMHYYEKPQSGTGASKLARVIDAMGTGRLVATSSFPSSDEEMSKVLLSLVREGAATILFDNVSKNVSSSALEGALTSGMIRGRVLQKTETFQAPMMASVD